MRRGRIFIYLGLILILGLVAVFVFLSRATAPTTAPTGEVPTAIESVDVVITTQRIEQGDVIEEGVVGMVAIPREQVIEGMFTNTGEVIGSVAKFDLDQGIFLTQSTVVSPDELLPSGGSDHALFIPRGMVAVSIPIDRLSSVSHGIQRGDHVNVIVTLLMVDVDAIFQSILPNNSSAVIAPGPSVVLTVSEEQENAPPQITSSVISDELLQTLTAQIAAGGLVSPIGRLELDQTIGQPFYIVPSETQRPRIVSQTLIQDAIVLRSGNFSLGEPTAAVEEQQQVEPVEGEQPAGEGEQQVVPQVEEPDIVTLIVSPQDAVTLNYLIFSGAKLSLALRNAKDDSQASTEAVTLQFLLDQYNIPIPAKLPFNLEPRIDVLEPPVLLNDVVPESEGQ